MTRAEREIRNEQMRQFKAQGKTMLEVAREFGVSKETAISVCKGISPQCGQTQFSRGTNKLLEDDQVSKLISEYLPGVEYAGNYSGCDGRVDLKCSLCGTIFNRSMISVRHKHCSCPKCRDEQYKATKQRKEQEEREREIQRQERQRAAEINKANNSKQLRLVVCGICGETFLTWNSRARYCSENCKVQARRLHTSYNRGSDDRLNNRNIIDRDISLKKLFARDGGVCQICGRVCDYNDCYTTESGVFIAGEDYPSRDHIVPLSQGGKHSWDNVRLAHRSCNSKIYWENQRI